MVKNTGKALCNDTVKPVNIPEVVNVEKDSSGRPVAVRTKRREIIECVLDRWRIDDEWWRSEPVSRSYYAVILTSGQRMVLYKDIFTGNWYKGH